MELNNVRRVLCLGAHSDDIEIGCGGTVLRLLAARPDVSVRWVVFSADARRDAEARNSAAAFLQGAREKDVVVKNFRDGFFPQQGEPMKEFFETLKKDFAPDLVLT
ncbi:MAG: PIG-L deacetylase family protein, partial [Tepidisphaeraceae bacterium]